MKEVTTQWYDDKVTGVTIAGVEFKMDRIIDDCIAIAPGILRGLAVGQVDKHVDFILRKKGEDGKLYNPYPVDICLSCKNPSQVKIVFSKRVLSFFITDENIAKDYKVHFAEQYYRVLAILNPKMYGGIPPTIIEGGIEWVDYCLTLTVEKFDQVIDYIEDVMRKVRGYTEALKMKSHRYKDAPLKSHMANYKSTQAILSGSSGLISNNE
jgi:hypothetical protein